MVVTARFVNQRLAAVPLEPNAALAVPDPEPDALTLCVPCQAPFRIRATVAEMLGLPADRVRVVTPAVGGGFGARIATAPEQVAVATLALRLGRPVRYAESRSESMVAMTHGRAQVQEAGHRPDRDLLHGQGHETAYTQLVAGTLGVTPEAVTVVHSDTALVPRGEGTMA